VQPAQWFDAWAETYDEVYAYLKHDLPFYTRLASEAHGPVLELGCGTGRVTLRMAAAGADVTGIDASPRMLDVARRKADASPYGSRIHLRVDDMRTMRLDRRFALAVMPFRSFQSMLMVEDQFAALQTAAEHLAPGGLLAFDLFNPDISMLADEDTSPFHLRDVRQGRGGRYWSIHGRNRWDHLAQVNHVRVDLREVRPGGKVSRRLHHEFDVRYTFRFEMEHLLRLSGFAPEAVHGDFKGGPLRPHSDDMVWLARRAV